jgi:hypothetical protein
MENVVVLFVVARDEKWLILVAKTKKVTLYYLCRSKDNRFIMGFIVG